MKKYAIKALCLFTVFVMVAGLCGCSGSGVDFSCDEIVEYMENKYGMDFELYGSEDDYVTKNYSLEVYVTTSSLPDKQIFAKCFVNDLDTLEKQYCDNYVACLYEDETRELVTEIANEVYPDGKVEYTAGQTQWDEIEGEITFENFLEQGDDLDFLILLPHGYSQATKDEDAEKLCALLNEKNIKGLVTVAWAQSDEQYDTFLTDDYVRGTYDLYANITLNGDSEEITWQ